jgi:hypothetical protein
MNNCKEVLLKSAEEFYGQLWNIYTTEARGIFARKEQTHININKC